MKLSSYLLQMDQYGFKQNIKLCSTVKLYSKVNRCFFFLFQTDTHQVFHYLAQCRNYGIKHFETFHNNTFILNFIAFIYSAIAIQYNTICMFTCWYLWIIYNCSLASILLFFFLSNTFHKSQFIFPIYIYIQFYVSIRHLSPCVCTIKNFESAYQSGQCPFTFWTNIQNRLRGINTINTIYLLFVYHFVHL